MRKKKLIKKRVINPDFKYNSVLVNKIINVFMRDGLKTKSKTVIYKAANLIEEKRPEIDFVTILEGAINNIKPNIELKRRKVGSGYQRTPIKISKERNLTLAISFLKKAVLDKKEGIPSYKKIASEILQAYNKSGSSFKRKENLIKEAETNRSSISF